MMNEARGAASAFGAGAVASLFETFNKFGKASDTSLGRSVWNGTDFSILVLPFHYQAKLGFPTDGLENFKDHSTRPQGNDLVFERRAVDGQAVRNSLRAL